jgi:phosphohistidine phosphatase
MRLFIIRHAWAEPAGDPSWPTDAERPLSEEGRSRFARMAAILAQRGVRPAVIATSPLLRCLQTAEILARAIGKPAEVEVWEELQPGGDPDELLRRSDEHAAEHNQIAWVGHAPDVEHLAAAMIGPGGSGIRFAKGAVAAIDFEAAIRPAAGELRWLATAKLLDC